MKTLSCIILFFIVSLSYSRAKISRLDSLRQLEPKVKGIQKLQVLSDISENLIIQNDFKGFVLNQAKLAKELDKNIKGSEEVREVYYCNQAYYFYTIPDFKKTIICYEKLLAVESDSDRSLQLKVMAYTNLSEIFRGLQQFQEALEYLNKAQKMIAKRKTDLYTKLIIIINQSRIYKDLADLAKSRNSPDEQEYFKKADDGYKTAYKIVKDLELSPDAEGLRLIQTYDMIATGLYSCNRRKEAKKLFDYAESFLLKYHLYGFYYNFKILEFNVKIEDEKLSASDCELLLKEIDKTINMAIPEQNSNFYFELYRRKAELLYHLKRYEESKAFFEKAEKLIGPDKDNLFTMNTYMIMGLVYQKTGNLNKSLLYKDLALKTAQDLLDDNALEGEKKTEALLRIQKMRQAKALEFEKIESERNRNYAMMLLLGLVLAIVIVVLLILFNKNLKTRQKLLFSELNYNKEVALKNELDGIYKVKFEIERQKALAESEKDIAKNLHDDLASGLAAMNFFIQDKVSFATTDKDKKSFNDIKDEVNNMYEGLRKYIHNLYNNKNLVLSVNEYLYDLMRKNDVLNSVRFNIKADFQKMDSLLNVFQQNQLYRIVKETVINSLKYSNSRNINVTIGLDEGRCQFSVEDDGQGFSYTSQQGIGLKNIQDRVGTLGGEVSVKSNQKQGVSLIGSFNYA